MTEINVYPNLKKTITMVKAKYTVFNYLPFTSAQISVQFFDENDIPVETRIYEINYNNGFDKWGTDDKYLENWVKNIIQQ